MRSRRTIQAHASERVIQLAAVPLQLQAAEGDPSGPPTFVLNAYNGGVMEVGFGLPVVVDLRGLKAARSSVPVLHDHNPRAVVGHTTKVANDGQSLNVSGIVSGASPEATQIVASAKNGFPWQVSIGANVVKSVEVAAGKTVVVNGQTFAGPLLVARQTQLREVSFVSLGADDTTSAKIAAQAAGANAMEFEKWLAAKGFDVATLSDDQRSTLEAAWKAEQAPPIQAAAPDPVTELRLSQAAEVVRIKAVRVAAGGDAELEAKAIAEGWTAERTELEALRASRTAAPAVHVVERTRQSALQTLQAAMVMQAGVPLDSPHFGGVAAVNLGLPSWLRAGLNADERQRAIEGAHRIAEMTTYDLARECLRIDGRDAVVSSGGRQDIIRAAFSGGTLTNVLTTDVNARLLQSYMEASDSTVGWVGEEDVADFRTQDRPRLTVVDGLKQLPAGGTAAHAVRSDTKESYRAHRFASQWVMDEQDVINDALRALIGTADDFGAAARRLRPDLVYYAMLANAALATDSVTLFHAASHGNLNTSAALAVATIKTAIAGIQKQQQNSVNLNLLPSHLIVPAELQYTGWELLQSPTIVTGSDTTKPSMSALPRAGLTVVADARLSNGVTDPITGTAASGSATTWFMAAAAARDIVVGYVAGTGRAPRVRQFVLDRGQWGVGWDVSMDIGVGVMGYRGLSKNTA